MHAIEWSVNPLLSERLWNFNFEKKIDRELLLRGIVSSQSDYFIPIEPSIFHEFSKQIGYTVYV